MSAGINASALEGSGARLTALQLLVTPALQAGDTNALLGGISTRRKRIGLGLGGSMSTSAAANNSSAFVGFAYKFEKASLGLATRLPDLSQISNFGIDLSGTIELDGGMQVGAVFYGLNSVPQLDVGLGMKGRTYFLQGSVLLPPLSALGSNYTATIAGGITPGRLGVFFRVSYYTTWTYLDYLFGASLWLAESLQMLVQYSTPRAVTLGFTFAF